MSFIVIAGSIGTGNIEISRSVAKELGAECIEIRTLKKQFAEEYATGSTLSPNDVLNYLGEFPVSNGRPNAKDERLVVRNAFKLYLSQTINTLHQEKPNAVVAMRTGIELAPKQATKVLVQMPEPQAAIISHYIRNPKKPFSQQVYSDYQTRLKNVQTQYFEHGIKKDFLDSTHYDIVIPVKPFPGFVKSQMFNEHEIFSEAVSASGFKEKLIMDTTQKIVDAIKKQNT